MRGMALVLAGLSVVACASANKAALKQTSTESAKSFAAGDFGKAIDLHRELYQKDPKNARIQAGYLSEIEAIKRAGDRAKGQGSFVAAQGAYRTLIDSWDGFSAIAGKLSFRRPDLEAGLKDCRVAMCQRIFRQEILAGHHAGALAVYQDAAKEYPGDASVKTMYAKGVGELRAMGAKSLAEKDYGEAGKINRLLLKNLDSFKGLGAPAERGASDRKDLEESLRVCSSGLTNNGLAEYRKGNLEKAIAIWADLLAFDPDNAEIRKAVETAKTQLGQLKGTSPGGAKDGSGRGGKDGQSGLRPGYY